MKPISDYAIYCTIEQTLKAYELGALIEIQKYIGGELPIGWHSIDDKCIHCPTAEQMVSWLEEKNIAVDLHTYFSVDNSKIHHYQYTVTDSLRVFNGEYSTRKEATLAAIDAALNYLKNLKQ